MTVPEHGVESSARPPQPQGEPRDLFDLLFEASSAEWIDLSITRGTRRLEIQFRVLPLAGRS